MFIGKREKLISCNSVKIHLREKHVSRRAVNIRYDLKKKKRKRKKRKERGKNDKNFHMYIYIYVSLSLKSLEQLFEKKI